MDDLSAFDLLQELSEQLEDGAQLDSELREWLLSAISAYESGRSMDEALGLNAKSASTWRQHRRDEWLVEAAGYCEGTPWQRCRRLAAKVQSPAHRAVGIDDVSRCLSHAARFGPLPTSAHQLHRLIAPHLHGTAADASESTPA